MKKLSTNMFQDTVGDCLRLMIEGILGRLSSLTEQLWLSKLNYVVYFHTVARPTSMLECSKDEEDELVEPGIHFSEDIKG